jgi:hypothetical protein
VKPCRTAVVLTALLHFAVRFQAQSLPLASADPASGPDSAVTDPVSPAPDEPLLSPKLLLRHIAADQKRIWLFPVAPVHGRHWKPALSIIGATAGLVALDPHDTPFFNGASYQRNPAVHGIGHVLSATNTGLFIAAVPISFYIAGLIHKDTYSTNTALLAGEAVVNAQIVTIAMKDIGRRLRPVDVGPNGNFNDTWFDSKTAASADSVAFLRAIPRPPSRWRRCLPSAIGPTAGCHGWPMGWPVWSACRG